MRKIQIISFSILLLILFIGIIVLITLPDYYFKIGVTEFNKANYAKAHENFKKARLWNKQNSDYRYYYVQTLAKFMPKYNLQKEMFAIANDSKKDSAHVFAGIQVSLWKNNIFQQYGSNYIEQVPINTDIIRWNPKTFPLKVYVSSKYSDYYPEYYTNEVIKAFGQWTAASGFIPFVFINNESAAHIVVKYEESPQTACVDSNCKYIVAHTNPIIRGRILKQMIITIYDKDANGSFFSDKELYSTVLHEIGHALGIMGHSYSTDDLMYMVNETNKADNLLFIKHRSDFQSVSTKDVNTLRLLYNIVPTISNTPISQFSTENLVYAPIVFGTSNDMGLQKLKEAKNYIEQAPNLPNGYIDMAIAYDSLGDTKRAFDAFQKAYNLADDEDDKFIILYNIAVMYLNSSELESAYEYAKQAKSVDDNEDVQDLISNIEHAMNTNTKPFWASRKTP